MPNRHSQAAARVDSSLRTEPATASETTTVHDSTEYSEKSGHIHPTPKADIGNKTLQQGLEDSLKESTVFRAYRVAELGQK